MKNHNFLNSKQTMYFLIFNRCFEKKNKYKWVLKLSHLFISKEDVNVNAKLIKWCDFAHKKNVYVFSILTLLRYLNLM